jgi:hypothetical protein
MTPEQKIKEEIKEIIDDGTRFIILIEDPFEHALLSNIPRLNYKYDQYTTHPSKIYNEVEIDILRTLHHARKNNDCIPSVFLTSNYFVIKSAVNVCEKHNIGKELAFVEWYDGDVRVSYGDNGMPDNSTIDASIELYEKEIERVLG